MRRKQKIDDIHRLVPEEECDGVPHGDSVEGRNKKREAFRLLVHGETSAQMTGLRAGICRKNVQFSIPDEAGAWIFLLQNPAIRPPHRARARAVTRMMKQAEKNIAGNRGLKQVHRGLEEGLSIDRRVQRQKLLLQFRIRK